MEPQEAPQLTQPAKPQSDDLKGNEAKASDPLTEEEKNIEIWEGLNRRKFVTEYFGIKEFAEEFNLKMQTAQIDKFIKGELEKRGYEKNIDNWKNILSEIETEIGSDRMELFSRIKKITGYVKAISRLRRAKELKDKFINSIIE